MRVPNPEMFEDWSEWAAAVKQELDKPVAYAPVEGVGRISVFKGTAVGSGYLLCDGASFSATSFPPLFQFLGSNVLPNLASPYGAGYVVGIKI